MLGIAGGPGAKDLQQPTSIRFEFRFPPLKRASEKKKLASAIYSTRCRTRDWEVNTNRIDNDIHLAQFEQIKQIYTGRLVRFVVEASHCAQSGLESLIRSPYA